MNRHQLGGVAAVIVAAAALAGCGGDPQVTADPNPAPVATVGQTEAADPAADPGESAQAYMQALSAIDNLDAMRDGLQHAAEDSTAHVYLQHQINMAEALLDGGMQFDPYQLSPVGGGYESCDPYDPTECRVYDGFTADATGLLTGFTVDGDNPELRLTVGNGETVESGGMAVEFLTAYQAITNDVFVVTARVTAGDQPLNLHIYSAVYRDPQGRQRQATDAAGPVELGADSTATVALIFASAEAGGQVTLPGDDPDYNTVEVTFDVG